VPVDRHVRSLSQDDLDAWPIGEKRSVLINLENGSRLRLTLVRTSERKFAVQGRGGLDVERLLNLPWSPLVAKDELDVHRECQDINAMTDDEATKATARALARLETRRR
jgi:hypothetical protein